MKVKDKRITTIIFLALLILSFLSYLAFSKINNKVNNKINNEIDNEISTVRINDAMIYVEVADHTQERIRGLMFRTSLDENSGMLFVFDKEQQLSFWMKNTLIPLDIIFIGNDLKIVDLKENFQPCMPDADCEVYTSLAKYALEVNAGFVRENGIKIGDKIGIIK